MIFVQDRVYREVCFPADLVVCWWPLRRWQVKNVVSGKVLMDNAVGGMGCAPGLRP